MPMTITNTKRINRSTQRSKSNNGDNSNKNICSLAIAKALKVDDVTRYLHNVNDLKRAVRSKYSMRSRKSMLTRKGDTMGKVRKAIMEYGDATSYIVNVRGHVLLIDSFGKVLVDTDPREIDRRQVLNIWGIFPPN